MSLLIDNHGGVDRVVDIISRQKLMSGFHINYDLNPIAAHGFVEVLSIEGNVSEEKIRRLKGPAFLKHSCVGGIGCLYSNIKENIHVLRTGRQHLSILAPQETPLADIQLMRNDLMPRIMHTFSS